MHDYDIAFKLVLQSVDLAMRELAGATVARWLSVELPEVRNTRVDLLGQTETGELLHIELQSSNDPRMSLRMAEYCLRVLRLFGKFPRQVLVYVDQAPLKMEAELNGPGLRYSYRLVDIRELDGERLLESPVIGDNIVAVLARLRDPRAAIRRVVERIVGLPHAEREEALARLAILVGLRKLGEVLEEEVAKMPITEDIMEHDLFGPRLRKARAEGMEEGLEQGMEQGLQQGERNLLRRQIEKRFGPSPSWVQERLSALSPPQLEALGERLLDATSLEQLFQ
jgi:predicted transposase YdaD